MTNTTQLSQYPNDFPEPIMISTNGIVLEVFEAGAENKEKAIVLCHGFPELAYSWRFQIQALVEAGYHVIVPNQRGYGRSSCPTMVEEYDIENLTNDLAGLLDHYGYKNATFVGHDWGANVVWHMALLHPQRVNKIINLALPYQERGDRPWIEVMEELFGEEFYFVHFNRKPGVAETVLNLQTYQFLSHLYRKNIPSSLPEPGMYLMNLALSDQAKGEPIMTEYELNVFVSVFKETGFQSAIHWYRNLDRNWHLMADVKPRVEHPTLMIYGEQDMIPKAANLKAFAPNLQVVNIDCGHWIQQEKPEETNNHILSFLRQ